MRRIIHALVSAAFICGIAQPAMAADTMYVVRHLPKMSEGTNPSLTPDAQRQAEALAAMLADKGVTAVFATPTRRAIETAYPLAKQLGLAVSLYDPPSTDEMLAEVRAARGAVLIVGHSNTVPDIVTRLGAAPAPVIGEQDYGTIYVVQAGSTKVETLALPVAR